MEIKNGKESDYITGLYGSTSLIATKLIYNCLGDEKDFQMKSHDFSEGGHIRYHTVEETVTAVSS